MFMTFDKRLYFYIPWIFLASSSKTFVRATLPASLQSSVPACAQNCLQYTIEQDYSGICYEPVTLDCLCTHYGHSGYVLGEGASTCIQSSNCSSIPQSNTSSISAICSGVSGAVPATHIPTPTLQPSTFAHSTSAAAATSVSATAAPSSPPVSSTAMTQASVSAGPDGVSMSGKLNLTMAQIAGITIAAAALLILTVGVFSCIFFVRKRNKRLEVEDQKVLTQSTPKSPDMQDIYFPPPPTSAGRRSRGSGRFSILPRQKPKDSNEGEAALQLPGTSLQQPTWPRYYPIMPDENIGIATTTSYPYPIDPVRPTAYTPALAPVPTPAPVPIAAPSATNSEVPRSSSTSTMPAYQPYSSYTASMAQPQPPPVAHISNTRTASQSSRSSGRTTSRARQSNAFSFRTEIEEGEQISSRETSLAEMSESTGSSRVSATPSTKKVRRPTLTINIPGQAQSKPSLPPPPAQKPPSKAPTVLPGPPPQQPPSRAPNTAVVSPPQLSTSRAPSTSATPSPQRTTQTVPATAEPPVRPPLLRDEHVQQIPNSPSDLLAAASSYASARKTSEASSMESAGSTSLPSSQVLAGGTFLLSDSERNSSSRSNSSMRRPSRGPSRGSRRGSDASCTSFEDDGEESEDETPHKEENRRLSPVTESSPVSALRYPKIPRGANQVVPRSPGSPKARETESPKQAHTPTRLRPEVNTSAAAAISQSIGNKLWKTELSPQGKKPLPTPEWAAHRRSESWQTWAQNTPEATSASTLQSPQKPLANGEGPRITPTRRGDELFLEMRF